ncbi:hypothetical protein GB937_007729 [Aspergillus fischeri]|nr:hypothetical protein GB937_007729 [Aspergillus fischeri]
MSYRHQPMEMVDAPIPSHHAIIDPRKFCSASIRSFDLMATPGHVLNVMGVQLAAVEPARSWAGGAVTPYRDESERAMG